MNNMIKAALSFFLVSCYMLHCKAQAPASFEPVAVVELFTSEGCSSCPPADKLLGETIKHYENGNKRIFALAFHVDYWNRLGWKDSFSTKQFSDRQGMYAQALHLNGVYTPQIVVNGTQEFVGSDGSSLDEALLKADSKKSSAEFSELKALSSGKQINVSYSLKGDFADSRINFALVSIHESIFVKSGENHGRQLEHTNVVRQFVTVQAASSGNIQLNDVAQTDNWMLIAYVQKNNGLAIVGAADVKLLSK
jgi:hypothetical protein